MTAGELKITPAAHKQLTLAGLAVYSTEGELVVASGEEVDTVEMRRPQTARLPPHSPSAGRKEPGGRKGPSKSIDSGSSGPVAPSVQDYLASSKATSTTMP